MFIVEKAKETLELTLGSGKIFCLAYLNAADKLCSCLPVYGAIMAVAKKLLSFQASIIMAFVKTKQNRWALIV